MTPHNRPFTHSIVSGHRARALLAALGPRDTATGGPFPDGTGRRDGITLAARRCARHRARSGGVVITASARVPTYGGLGLVVTRRLRPGWTPASFTRTASGLFSIARAECHLIALREQVYRLVGDTPRAPAWLAEVDAAERASGHTSEYDRMSHEACAFWLDWLAAHPPVPAAQEVTR